MRTILIAISIALSCIASFANAQDMHWVPQYGTVSPPPGWVQFCNRGISAYNEICNRPQQSAIVQFAAASFNAVQAVNGYVNDTITPVDDPVHWGSTVLEQWDIPTDYMGDCEDYVLLKKEILVNKNLFPPGSLLITVVRDEKGDGHAVLTWVTSRGDYILDNRRSDLRPWYETGYSFVERQSPDDPNRWVSLVAPPVPVASAEPSSEAGKGDLLPINIVPQPQHQNRKHYKRAEAAQRQKKS